MISKRKLFVAMIIFLCYLCSFLPETKASELEDFAREISLLPSLLETDIPKPDSSGLYWIIRATCFPLLVTIQGKDSSLFLVANYHPFIVSDSLERITAEVDSGIVFWNAQDTVIPLRVKIFRKNPNMDLILLKTPDPIPSKFRLKTTVLVIDLAEEPPPPVVGERIFYGGFPRLLGRDTTLKQNYPLVMDGIVSQVVPADPYFIVQAPVFSGASGSPILSQKDGHFLGVLFGTIPEQESFLYAVKASVLSAWIKDIIFKRK